MCLLPMLVCVHACTCARVHACVFMRVSVSMCDCVCICACLCPSVLGKHSLRDPAQKKGSNLVVVDIALVPYILRRPRPLGWVLCVHAVRCGVLRCGALRCVALRCVHF